MMLDASSMHSGSSLNTIWLAQGYDTRTLPDIAMRILYLHCGNLVTDWFVLEAPSTRRSP
jgi:hypothetical protein